MNMMMAIWHRNGFLWVDVPCPAAREPSSLSVRAQEEPAAKVTTNLNPLDDGPFHLHLPDGPRSNKT